jgi:hypothetical protein
MYKAEKTVHVVAERRNYKLTQLKFSTMDPVRIEKLFLTGEILLYLGHEKEDAPQFKV